MSTQPKPTKDYKHSTQFEQQYTQPKPTGDRFVMKNHMIFDTQSDALIGAGDACYLLNEASQPKSAGEWTVSTIDEWIRLNPSSWRSVIAFEHNASLAAEKAREEFDWGHVKREYLRLQDENDKLKKQLDAERENVQTLVDALKANMNCDKGCYKLGEAALLQVKEGK